MIRMHQDMSVKIISLLKPTSCENTESNLYGKLFYYLLSKIDILYIISDILYRM